MKWGGRRVDLPRGEFDLGLEVVDGVIVTCRLPSRLIVVVARVLTVGRSPVLPPP